MALTDPEVRVLAALIEKEAAVPESYPLTLNALRLACNQSTNRRPVVVLRRPHRRGGAAVVEVGRAGPLRPPVAWRANDALSPHRRRTLASDAGRVARRCRRSRCAGAQTAAEIRSRIERLLPADESSTVEELLDALAARSPEPLAVRLGRRPGRARRSLGGGHRLGGDGRRSPTRRDDDDDVTGPLDFAEPAWRDDSLSKRVDELEATVADLGSRLQRLEQLAGAAGLYSSAGDSS